MEMREPGLDLPPDSGSLFLNMIKTYTYRKTTGKHRCSSGRVLAKGDTVDVAFVEDLSYYGDRRTWEAVSEEAPSRVAMRREIDDTPSIIAQTAGEGRSHICSRSTGRRLSRTTVSEAEAGKLIESRVITLPRIWDKEDVFIIGGGPSVAGMHLEPIHDRCVIGVNQAFELGDWVDVCFFVDNRWVNWNKETLQHFPNLKIGALGNNISTSFGIKLVDRDRQQHQGLCKTSNAVRYNSNGGACAINAALHFGAARIFLIGFDMQVKSGKHNWHDKHQATSKDDIYSTRFLGSFDQIKKDADVLGLEIINVTPDSALEVFEKGTLEDFI
jgi:hypothetical protein